MDWNIFLAVEIALLTLTVLSTLVFIAAWIKGLRAEVDKFLQPQFRFYIRNVLQRRIVMKDTEKQTATIAVTDAKGFPVSQPTFDSPPAYTIDDPTVASLSPSADGLSCDVVALAPGSTNLNVAATAGGNSFAGSVAVLVTSGDAAKISISLGAPVAQ